MEQKSGLVVGLVVGSILLLSLNHVYGQKNEVIVTKGLAGNEVLTGGLDNDVLTVGPGANSFNCGPEDNIIKDFNKTKGNTTLENCEPSKKPVDCNLIVNVIKELKAKRVVLVDKLQSASATQGPDFDDALDPQIASLNAQLDSLDAQINNLEKLFTNGCQ